MEQEWQGQFSATNKRGNQNPNTHKRRFDDHHHHDAKVHTLLFTKIICKRCSVCDPAQYKLDEEKSKLCRFRSGN
jgi:hypothetical protein